MADTSGGSVELLTPAEWSRRTGIRIMDPDGWRGHLADIPMTEPISRDAYLRRAAISTCARWPRPLLDERSD